MSTIAQPAYRFWGHFPLLYRIACTVTFLGRQRFLRRRAVERLALRPGDTVLDLACGTGLNLAHLEAVVGDRGRIIAFDFSPAMLAAARDRARTHGWQNIEFVEGDAATLDIGGPVDGVLSTLGVSAIAGYERAIARACEVVRPGGRVVILDAALPTGWLRCMNPLIRWVYRVGAAWVPGRPIAAIMARHLNGVHTERYNGGTIEIMVGIRAV
jgi:demethylmenaquinone methyltransferase/2-methoxy-6-polyprenyl-1,4-benzoquinol methylase